MFALAEAERNIKNVAVNKMKIGKRIFDPSIVFDRRHYLALSNMFLLCLRPVDFFFRYFLAKGNYPAIVGLRTPQGVVSPTMHCYDDSLTVNEIFFRGDYKAGKKIKVFVDIGANIGVSALYFLTRNSFCRGYLYEPVPANLIKLNENLKEFLGRVNIFKQAVYNSSGKINFGVENTGRLGGINRVMNQCIEVDCVHINDVLESVLKKEEFIDVLKIDIEGDEIKVVEAIDKRFYDKIGVIYFDIDHTLTIEKGAKFFDDRFVESRYGNTYIIKNKKYSI
jgi:FkbM family methyltransferase